MSGRRPRVDAHAVRSLLAALGVAVVAAHVGWRFVSSGPAMPVLELGLLACMAYLASSPLAMLVGFMAVLFIRPAEIFPALEVLMLGKLTMVATLGYFLLSRFVERKLRPVSSGFNLYMIWLTVAVYISGYLGIARAESQAVFQEVFIKIVLLFFLVLNLVDSPSRSRQLMLALSGLVAFVGAYTLWAKFTGTDLVEGSRAGGVGMLGDPNDTAMTLLLVAPFLIAAWLDTRGLLRLAVLVLLLLVLGGLVATQSRGGFIGLAVGLFVLFKHRLKSRMVTLGVVGLVFAAVLAVGLRGRETVQSGQLDESAQGRLIAWKAGLRMVEARPLFGMGFSTFGYAFPSYAEALPFEKKSMTAHNSYILCAAEVGIAGTIPFLLLVVGTLTLSAQIAAKARSMPASLERAVLTGFAGNAAASFTAAFFLSQTWLWFFYIIFAQAAALARLHGLRFRPGRWFMRQLSPRVVRQPLPGGARP